MGFLVDFFKGTSDIQKVERYAYTMIMKMIFWKTKAGSLLMKHPSWMSGFAGRIGSTLSFKLTAPSPVL